MTFNPRAQSPEASARQSFELAVAIPTFDRAEQLASLLAQLAEETRGVRDKVFVAVSNNHSSDSTATVLDDYARRHPDIALEVYEQEANIGAIPNIHFLVGVARAEWTWCLGDDDLLFEGALRRVLSTLPSIDGNLFLVRTEGIPEWDRIRPVGGLRHVHAASDEGARCMMASTFLASALIRTATWQGLRERAEAFGAPHYANWAAALMAGTRDGDIALLDEKTVRGNANMVGGVRFDAYQVLVLERLRVWRELHDAGGAEREVANGIGPLVAEIFWRTWRSIAATSDRSLPSAGDRIRGFMPGLRLLGWPAAPALPWLIVTFVLPKRLRSALMRARKRAMGEA